MLSKAPFIIIPVIGWGVLFIHLMIRFWFGRIQDGVDPIALSLVVLGSLPWMAAIINRLKVAGVEVEFMDRLEKQQTDIDAIKFLVANFLSEGEVKTLTLFQTQEPILAEAEWGSWSLNVYQSQLRHMRDLGLLVNNKGKTIAEIFDDIETKRIKDVHEYLSITESGRNYLGMRARWIENTILAR